MVQRPSSRRLSTLSPPHLFNPGGRIPASGPSTALGRGQWEPSPRLSAQFLLELSLHSADYVYQPAQPSRVRREPVLIDSFAPPVLLPTSDFNQMPRPDLHFRRIFSIHS